MIWTDNWPAAYRKVVDTVTIRGHHIRCGVRSRDVACSRTCQPPHSCPYIPSSSTAREPTTWQVDCGVEIVDTNGKPERFDFNNFAITD